MLFVGYVLGLCVLSQIATSPTKPYRRFFEAVRVGMTPPQVTRLLHENFPSGGRFKLPAANGDGISYIHYNLDLSDGRYDAETITIDLSHGRVSGKEYSPD